MQVLSYLFIYELQPLFSSEKCELLSGSITCHSKAPKKFIFELLSVCLISSQLGAHNKLPKNITLRVLQ